MAMKELYKRLMWLFYVLLLGLLFLFASCGNDDEPEPDASLTGNKTIFNLTERGESGISGFITLEERGNSSTLVTVLLTGTSGGGSYPSHIHENSAAESGGIAVSLTNIDGSTGTSITEVSQKDDGTSITYSEIIAFDGHIKVHLSESDLSTIVTEGEMGGNILTGQSEMYLIEGDGIQGNVKFEKRESGQTLATVTIIGASDAADHPSHIHANTAVEGGSILISFNNISATTGIGLTHIEMTDDGTAITYDELIDFDGHLVVHASSVDFSNIAGGDIGQNALTGNAVEYSINQVGASGVSGIAVFEERSNGSTLITFELSGTTPGGEHPNHIHLNSLIEGGSIFLGFSNINGNTGKGETNVESLPDGTTLSYEELINFDGHFKIHNSPMDFGIIAEGEAGGNVFTGETEVFQILEVSNSGVFGTATFAERKNGFTVITLDLQGTFGDSHPAHIHQNVDGSIVLSFGNVNGSNGSSINHIEKMDNGDEITYEGLIDFGGFIRVHISDVDFSAVAEGNIESNAN